MSEEIMNWQPSHLQDDLVTLQPLAEAGFAELYQVASDPLIWEQHPSNDRYQQKVFQAYFDDAVTARTAFLIRDTASYTVIGCTRYYDYKPDNSSIAIGFTFLARHYWGGHYNRSVKKLMIDYAFRFVENIYFHIGQLNIRSQLGTSKLGAVKVGEAELEGQGKKIVHYEYLIRKLDWNG